MMIRPTPISVKDGHMTIENMNGRLIEEHILGLIRYTLLQIPNF